MNKKGFIKLSDEELRKRIARYEKQRTNLKRYGLLGAIIGLIGVLICMALGSELVVIFVFMILLVGGVCYYMCAHLRWKAESLVREQLDDFFEAELEKTFGPRLHTPEMSINESFLKEIHPVDRHWTNCRVWRFYEGNYHGTHFSASNVELYELRQLAGEDDTRDATETVFEGVVLRCRNICDPALDIALRRPWTDSKKSDSPDSHTSDITDPAVFHQHFSARTADDQPADDWVTPGLRELIRKLESLSEKYTVNALIFRDGEVILALSGWHSFADSLPPKGKSLQNIPEIKMRFPASLTPMCDLIDTLRDSCGEI